MSDFKAYEEPTTPMKVRRIEIWVTSLLVPDLDEYGDPIGTDTETETLFARAAVEDQDGIEQWVHNANHTVLIDKGILTTQQLQSMRDFIQAFRDSVETVLLPT